MSRRLMDRDSHSKLDDRRQIHGRPVQVCVCVCAYVRVYVHVCVCNCLHSFNVTQQDI